jgi:hypothetical protein
VVAEWAFHDHIRALLSKWGVKFETKAISDLIGGSIEELASVLRIDGKLSSFNFQAGKLLKDGNDAAHYSQAKLFHEWMLVNNPGVVVPDTGRGMIGG